MKNLKISLKLMLSFSIVIILAVILGIMGIIGMMRLNQGASDLYDNEIVAIGALANIREQFGAQRSDIRNIFLSSSDPDRVRSLIAGIAESDKLVDENIAIYEALISDPSTETDFLTARDAWKGPYAQMKTAMWPMIEQGDYDGAYNYFLSNAGVIAPITNGLRDSTSSNDASALAQNIKNDGIFTTLMITIIVLMALTLILSVIITFYVSGLISKPLNVLSSFMKKAGTTGDITLTPGDLAEINKFGQYRDEIGQTISNTASFIKHVTTVAAELDTVAKGDLTLNLELLSEADVMGRSLNHVVSTLNGMFGEINASAGQVSTGSKQIAGGAQALAQGSTEQASAVEQLSASISEINNMAKESSKTASAALEEVRKSGELMGVCTEQMDRMMAAMRTIDEKSKDILKTTKVIDDIAFQTNILALNAAVEAARAGQHGKGFAVVAEEVRNLASKSAEAAKETAALLESSSQSVEGGNRIVEKVNESLQSVVEISKKNAVDIENIQSISYQQSHAMAQVTTGIDQVAQVVQQNSATAEESAAASEEMSGQSAMLQELISRFKTSKGTGKMNLPAPGGHTAGHVAAEEQPKSEFSREGNFGKY
ncbi:MAG: methyl-accepting chemotaxis protein [Oscillospiraceae bacterium]|nr:methyl-accepting chemotaxis protein [Oscillospiraceae bacterium]